jgi:hypothetical protein
MHPARNSLASERANCSDAVKCFVFYFQFIWFKTIFFFSLFVNRKSEFQLSSRHRILFSLFFFLLFICLHCSFYLMWLCFLVGLRTFVKAFFFFPHLFFFFSFSADAVLLATVAVLAALAVSIQASSHSEAPGTSKGPRVSSQKKKKKKKKRKNDFFFFFFFRFFFFSRTCRMCTHFSHRQLRRR